MKHKQIQHTNWYEQYIDLINQGLSQRKACKEMGVPRSTIQHWLAEKEVCDVIIENHKEVVDETAYLLSTPRNAKRLMDSVTQLTKQPLNILVISDCQVKNGVDLSYLTAIGKYIASKKPDVVVNIGDFWDFPSLSSYDKGKLSFEGRRLKADIEIGNKGMDLLLAPIKQEFDYSPRMIFTLGNHECLTGDAEVLTTEGFVNIKDVTTEHFVATYRDGFNLEWQKPSVVFSKKYSGKMHKYESRSFYLNCTERHRMYTVSQTENLQVRESKDVPDNFKIISSLNQEEEYPIEDNCLRLAAWLCTDSYHPISGNSKVLYQRESNAHKVRDVLSKAGVKWKENARDRDITQICGKKLLKKPEASVEFYLDKNTIPVNVSSNKYLPDWVKHLSNRQFDVFLEQLIEADGSLPTKCVNSRVFYGAKRICEDVQLAAVLHGWSASLTEYRENQWRVNLNKRNTRKQEGLKKYEYNYTGDVFCLEIPNSNFMVRQGNKCHITGNCRLQRVAKDNPEMSGFIDYHLLNLSDWEVHDFLKPVEVNGVWFTHYLQNQLTGKPLGGSALNMLKTVGQSFVVGHRQVLDIAVRPVLSGGLQIGVICGACYLHKEDYLGHTGNNHFRGITVLHNTIDGFGNPMFVDTKYLVENYL